MKTTALGFIGGGRITKILLQAFVNKNVKFESVVVFDTDSELVEKLTNRFSFVKSGSLEQAASQATVVIALHPPVIMESLEKIAGIVTAETLLVSLAPKTTIKTLGSKLRTKSIARCIPNATSYLNKGFNPFACHDEMDPSDKKQLSSLLMNLGELFETEEEKLEAYAVASAMLPTYFWFQFREMEKIAQQCGLSPEEAKTSLESTLRSTIDLYFDAGLSPEQVMDLIPVKPIGEHQEQIAEIYQSKLMGLFAKIRP